MSGDFSQVFLSHTGKLADKWSSYLPVYDRVLHDYQNSAISMLEIGIQNGGSLEIWCKYFPLAKVIVGCDIDEKCKELNFQDNRVRVIVGDANQQSVVESIKEYSPEYEIIIDDGSHHSMDIIASFLHYFPLVKDNGVYIIEDLHTSYWNHYRGGLGRPDSAIEFFKRLIDVTNFEHWGFPRTRLSYMDHFIPETLASQMESNFNHIYEISFLNSMCIIKKKTPEEGKLGVRRVLGSEEPVTENAKQLDGQENTPHMQSVKLRQSKKFRFKFKQPFSQ